MGGLPCFKELIDQRNALVQQLDCLVATMIAALVKGFEPTYEERDAFRAGCDALAKIAATIEARIGAEAGVS